MLPAPFVRLFAMGDTSDKVRRNVGPGFYPRSKCITRDSDIPAKPTDREILSVGELVCGRLADVKVPSDLADGHVAADFIGLHVFHRINLQSIFGKQNTVQV